MANIQDTLVEKGAEIVVLLFGAGIVLAIIGGNLIDLAGAIL